MGKYNLMLVATIAIGVFALPMVVSTFSGSHAFVAGENVDCLKCHADVEAELASSSTNHTHANDDWDDIQVFECDECHNVSGIGESPGGGHAAQKVDCAFCHNKTVFGGSEGAYYDFMHDLDDKYGMACADCHTPGMDRLEGMFLDDVFDEITMESAAHYTFYQNAVNDTTLLGGSESCVGCHTHAEMNFTQALGTYSMTYDPITGTFGKE